VPIGLLELDPKRLDFIWVVCYNRFTRLGKGIKLNKIFHLPNPDDTALYYPIDRAV